MRNEYRIVEKTNPSKDGILTYYQVQHKDNEKTDWGYRDNEPRWETVHEVPKSDFNWCYVGGGVRFASIDEAKDFLVASTLASTSTLSSSCIQLLT